MAAHRRLLVVGLGNAASASYRLTRHSLGQLVVEQLARTHGRELALDRPVKGLLGAATSELSTGETIELCLFVPPTLMNVCGPTVARAMRALLPNGTRDASSLVVLHDELEHKPGKVTHRLGGSVGGHNGLASVRTSIGSADFWRVRLGVGRPESREPRDVAAYVLQPLNSAEVAAASVVKGEPGAVLDLALRALNAVALAPPTPVRAPR